MAVLESRTASDDSELFVMPNICTTPVMVNYIMEAELINKTVQIIM
jgi:hypothetical protein